MNISKRYNKKVSKEILKKQLNKLLLSMAILAIVFIINNINTTYTNKATSTIKTTLNYKVNLNDKRIKDFQKAVTTFNIINITDNYDTPIQGTLHRKHSSNQEGIDIIAYEEFVKSVSSGEVIEVNKKNTGIEVKILHGDIKSVYSRMEKVSVKEGEKVSKGYIIGSMGDISRKNIYLQFEMWKDNKPIDPLEYIKINDKTPLSY